MEAKAYRCIPKRSAQAVSVKAVKHSLAQYQRVDARAHELWIMSDTAIFYRHRSKSWSVISSVPKHNRSSLKGAEKETMVRTSNDWVNGLPPSFQTVEHGAHRDESYLAIQPVKSNLRYTLTNFVRIRWYSATP